MSKEEFESYISEIKIIINTNLESPKKKEELLNFIENSVAQKSTRKLRKTKKEIKDQLIGEKIGNELFDALNKF